MKVLRFRISCLMSIAAVTFLSIYLFFFAQNEMFNSSETNDIINSNSQAISKGTKVNAYQKLCNTTIHLPKFGLKYSEKNQQLFFVESYGNPSYRGRQLCSIESALRRSNMNVKIITLSLSLDINSAALCRLVEEFFPEKLQFYTTTMEELFRSLPVETVIPRLEKDESRIRFTNTHKSDMMRYSLLYKFGGFALDLDVIVLKDLTEFKNTIGMEAYT